MRHQGIQKAFTLREGLFHLGRATRALFLVDRPWHRVGAKGGAACSAPRGLCEAAPKRKKYAEKYAEKNTYRWRFSMDWAAAAAWGCIDVGTVSV
ncbi:hypothetical protein [Achromobacter ruhlandii]|uniref:hypothetical protein n=1 Tax=Achromobacter ruhlandii TaxID=72557 RepID=UPI001EEEF9A3|nr:hypothetical protein [Achromobacter ruhlandii]MCZ8397655.1 hypothetical protein [Achromobacter ruhlandii]